MPNAWSYLYIYLPIRAMVRTDKHEEGRGAGNVLEFVPGDYARGEERGNDASAEAEGEADDTAGLQGGVDWLFWRV